ncbi:MAG: hypothetical protein WKF34_08285 [Pyrinomonadaceae bacterium]
MIRNDFRSCFRIAGAAGLVLVGSLTALAQKDLPINVVQGSKNISAHDREQVRVSGIVTARTRSGFFIQTPDDKIDSDPATSEGILIFTRDEPPVEAAIGNLISVSGMVTEFRPRAEPASLPITEISHRKGQDSISVVATGLALPRQVVLTVADFKPNALDQLERYEGMRVLASELVVTAPTDGRVDNKNNRSISSGTFYGVIKGLPKPFREPGYDLYEYIFLSDKEKEEFKKAYPKVGFFDANPERLRIESSAQLGSDAINIPALTELKNVAGVLHYSYRTYTILLDAATRPSVASYPKNNALPVANDRQFSIAGMNLENFFDDKDDADIKEDIVTSASFESRMKKISLAIRNVVRTPDVVGIIESENLAALRRLAEKVNSDAVAAGKPDPKYEAYLTEGNDGRGIDSGFLVKSSRVKMIEVKQLGKSDKYKNPDTGQENNLNDRTPLMLRASVIDAKTNQPFEFTVVVNHLKSFLGYNDPKQMANVRLKKKLQAEFLARFVQERQKANPTEKIILIGDFNAFQFSDAVVDVIGTIKGKSTAKDELMHPADDIVEPDMINLVDLIAADQKYSYRFDGNAQVLDHIIVSNSLRGHIHGFGYARVNADFPESMRSDDTRPERFSDHDAAVAYFNLDERVMGAPVKSPN